MSPPSECLHYQKVVDDADSNGGGGAAAAEAFFELANASVLRYTVSEKAELLVEQDQALQTSCGGIVWESAFCLAGYLRTHIERRCVQPPVSRSNGLRGCRVLEVGAGCGLLGMALAVMGAKKVVLTDHPDALPLLRRNVERNAEVLGGGPGGGGSTGGGGDGGGGNGKKESEAAAERDCSAGKNNETTKTRRRREGDNGAGSPRCMPLDWEDGSHLSAVAALGPFDVILATDVVFNAKLVAGPWTPHTSRPLRLLNLSMQLESRLECVRMRLLE